MKHANLLLALILMPLLAIGVLAAEADAAKAPQEATADEAAANTAEDSSGDKNMVQGDDLDAFEDEDEVSSEDEDQFANYEKDDPLTLNFVVQAIPAALLINAGDTFEVSTEDGGSVDLETVYMMPNLSVGAGVELEQFYLDVTVGAGIVVSETFRSFLLQGSVALWYEAADAFAVGPHIGVIYFPNPKWLDTTYDVEFDDTWGYVVGLQLAMGDKVQYYVSVDLISAAFDASDDDEDVALDFEDSEFDLTGLAVQFGVRGVF